MFLKKGREVEKTGFDLLEATCLGLLFPPA